MYHVQCIHRLKQLMCKLNIKILTKKYTILWFELDMCGLLHQQDRDKTETTVARAYNGSACKVTAKLSTK